MIGLITKDLLLIIKNLSFIYFLPLLVLILPISQNPVLLMPILSIGITLLLASQVLNTFTLDENVNWQKNIMCMPVTPNGEVLSKFMLSCMLSSFSTILVFFIGIIAATYNIISIKDIASYVILCFGGGLLYNSIVIPTAYKYGSAKCRYILYFFIIIPTALPYILSVFNFRYQLSDILAKFKVLNGLLIASGFVLLIAIVSYYISVRIRKIRI
jgi:hypothetical protein